MKVRYFLGIIISGFLMTSCGNSSLVVFETKNINQNSPDDGTVVDTSYDSLKDRLIYKNTTGIKVKAQTAFETKTDKEAKK